MIPSYPARLVRMLAALAGAVFLTAPGWGESPDPALPGATPGAAPEKCEKKKEEPKKGEKKKDDPESPWAKMPPIRVIPPAGSPPQLPTGPGFYSLHDWLSGTRREGPPKYGYPRLWAIPAPFFDADWRYLESPKNKDHDLFDPLHRCHLGCNWLFNTGGEFRWRHMHEVNARFTDRDNTYDLIHTRVYGDLWHRDDFRVYLEFLDAHSFNEDLPPLPTDVDRADFLNAFIDLKACEIGGRPAYVRVGRQEMLFGSQRLISTLDWGNTRRTFQGVRAFRAGEKFDVDLFWVQPVIPHPSHIDSVDNNQNFAGVWTTYRPKKGHFIDAYYLFFDHTRPPVRRGDPGPVATNVHTLGTRYLGDHEQRWLWDVELMLQLGERGRQDVIAGATAVNGGYHCKDLPMNPTFWAGWEFASGDRGGPDGTHFSTFNQLFNFGHYYLGFLDLVGRQNIHDINAQVYLYPTKWITVLLQYHHFLLASSTDALYSAAGVPLRRDPTGRAGSHVGDELDLYVNFHLSKHSDFVVGYSKLWAGSFIRETGPGVSPELLYLIYNFRW